MNKVKRYNPGVIWDRGTGVGSMQIDILGRYITFEDYIKLLDDVKEYVSFVLYNDDGYEDKAKELFGKEILADKESTAEKVKQ